MGSPARPAPPAGRGYSGTALSTGLRGGPVDSALGPERSLVAAAQETLDDVACWLITLTHRKGKVTMNSDITKLAKWAEKNGYRVEDDTKGYTHFFDPEGNWVSRYPATPSNARRRMADLMVALKKSGLQIPPPSRAEQRAQRRREEEAR